MRIQLNQLSNELTQLKRTYWLASEEYALLADAKRQLSTAFRGQDNNTERLSYQLNDKLNWAELTADNQALSLFGEKRLIEFSLATGKMSATLGNALREYLSSLHSDCLLIISSDRLDASMQKSKWFKALEAELVLVPIWPLEGAALKQWLMQKAKQAQLNLNAEALALLAERSTGNLLAAEQALAQLALIYTDASVAVNAEILDQVLNDQARFDVFNWLGAIRQQNAKSVVRIFQRLLDEGTAEPILLWALLRELRLLIDIKEAHGENNLPPANVLQRFGVWQKQVREVQQQLQRHTLADLKALQSAAFTIDCQIKGAEPGEPRLGLLDLALQLAGEPLWQSA